MYSLDLFSRIVSGNNKNISIVFNIKREMDFACVENEPKSTVDQTKESQAAENWKNDLAKTDPCLFQIGLLASCAEYKA